MIQVLYFFQDSDENLHLICGKLKLLDRKHFKPEQHSESIHQNHKMFLGSNKFVNLIFVSWGSLLTKYGHWVTSAQILLKIHLTSEKFTIYNISYKFTIQKFVSIVSIGKDEQKTENTKRDYKLGKQIRNVGTNALTSLQQQKIFRTNVLTLKQDQEELVVPAINQVPEFKEVIYR